MKSLLSVFLVLTCYTHSCMADYDFIPPTSILNGPEVFEITANDGSKTLMTLSFTGGNLSGGVLFDIGAGIHVGSNSSVGFDDPAVIGWAITNLDNHTSYTNDLTLRAEFTRPLTANIGVGNQLSPSDIQTIRTDGDIRFAGGSLDQSSAWNLVGDEITTTSAFSYTPGEFAISRNPFFENATFIEFELQSFRVTFDTEKRIGFSIDPITTVPEPNSLTLVVTGFVLCSLFRRRRRTTCSNRKKQRDR